MIARILIVVGLVAGASLMARAQSVLPNGDFEQKDALHPGKPLHWDAMDGLGVRWTDAPVVQGAPPHGKAIRMDTAQTEAAMVDSYQKAGLTQWVFPDPSTHAPIGESYGLSLYSDPVPIIPGKTYRVTFDFMSETGTSGKVWFRAYADENGQKKRVYEGTLDSAKAKQPTWKTYTALFHPTKYRANAAEFKIMLFAYFPDGVAWFDNVKVEAIDEEPAAQ